MRIRYVLGSICLMVFVVNGNLSCRGPARSSPGEPRPEPATKAKQPEPPKMSKVESVPIELVDNEMQETWLKTLVVREGAKVGEMLGSFDKDRNRITIQSNGTRRFSLDTSALPIDWSRLLVLKLDGHNSVLKQREDPVIVFEVTVNGEWLVKEKPKADEP